MTALRRSVFTALAGAMAAALLFSLVTAFDARATHEPAMKAGAAGSDIDQVNDATAILSETMRVSSQEDVIIQVTAECSILTKLTTGPSATGGASDSAFAFGSVRLWVELDGKRVPVAIDDPALGNDNDDVVQDPNDPSDEGEVTFCNRAYQRTVTDGEDDGIDKEEDFIDTRTANAFNWLALDTGFEYDSPANGHNILHVVLWADFDETTMGEAAADAFVGSRTMIIEPIKVSIHEEVAPHEPTPAPAKGKG